LDITGIYHEKRATIISASMPKYVDGIRGCTTQAFPGATIGRITELLSRGKINISNIDIVVIHVGTNNIEVPTKFKCNPSLGAYKEESGRLFNKKNYDINLYTVLFF
jgi:hypothetical protein